jgi:aminopeptidase N
MPLKQCFRRNGLAFMAGLSLFAALFQAQAPKPAASKFQYPQMEGVAQTPAPRTFDALHYVLRTRFDRKTKTVFGDETITLKPLAGNFQELRLDAANLVIEAVTLSGADAKLQWRREKPQKLVIRLSRAYAAGETLSVRIVYRAVNPRRGLYFTPEATLKLPKINLRRPPQIWTQGEPQDNRFWFAAHDAPDDFATSEQYITVTTPQETAIANGKLLETIENADNTRTFHWRMEQAHATYLISLVVGEFVKLEDSVTLPAATPDGAERSVPLEYYTYAGAEDAARNAYSRTPEMMRVFSRALGKQYPFARYAQTGVAFFDQFEGMENITATTVSDTSILRPSLFAAPDKDLPMFDRRDVDNLVAHELAHSWFGNLVTCQDWPHLWLNEGITTFMEAVWHESIAGNVGYLREMRRNQDLFLAEDRFRYRRPLVTNRYKDATQLFDGATYKKGGFVVHMLRRHLGEESFWRGLNLYLTRFAGQNVTTPDFQSVMEEASGQKLDWFFRQWVYQAGFPELRVRYSYNEAKKELALNVRQTQKSDPTTPDVFLLPGAQVEIAFPGGVRTESVNITGRHQTFTFSLEKAPLSVYFDADERILKELDYPQQPGSTVMDKGGKASDKPARP